MLGPSFLTDIQEGLLDATQKDLISKIQIQRLVKLKSTLHELRGRPLLGHAEKIYLNH